MIATLAHAAGGLPHLHPEEVFLFVALAVTGVARLWLARREVRAK